MNLIYEQGRLKGIEFTSNTNNLKDEGYSIKNTGTHFSTMKNSIY